MVLSDLTYKVFVSVGAKQGAVAGGVIGIIVIICAVGAVW